MAPPSAANSPLGPDCSLREDLRDDEGQNDPEVRRLQSELKRVRKERILLQLHAEIAHEKQLMEQTRQRLSDSQLRPSVSESSQSELCSSTPTRHAAIPDGGKLDLPLSVHMKSTSRQSPRSPSPSAQLAAQIPVGSQTHPQTLAPTQPAARHANGKQNTPAQKQQLMNQSHQSQLDTQSRPPIAGPSQVDFSRSTLPQNTTLPSGGQSNLPLSARVGPAKESPQRTPSTLTKPSTGRAANQQPRSPILAPTGPAADFKPPKLHSLIQGQQTPISQRHEPANGQLPAKKQPPRVDPSNPDTKDESKKNIKIKTENGDGIDYSNRSPDAPPALTSVGTYYGENRQEFHCFMAYLRAHFQTYSEYFRPDYRKIGEARRHIADGLWCEWAKEISSRADPPTWNEFYNFLHAQIRSTITPAAALMRYNIAKQRSYQSVTDFARYLNRTEQQVDKLITDPMRCDRIYEGASEAIQRRVGRQRPGMKYDDYLTLLQRAESRLSERSTSADAADGKRRRIC